MNDTGLASVLFPAQVLGGPWTPAHRERGDHDDIRRLTAEAVDGSTP
ncbi:hypothetical protein [Streptomyces sp. NPDC050287]